MAKYVREFKTEFWDDRLKDWIDEWKQTNLIPVLVRVSFKVADNEFTPHIREQVTRIVSLPSVGVSSVWQTPAVGGPGGPGGPGGFPGGTGLPPTPGQGFPPRLPQIQRNS